MRKYGYTVVHRTTPYRESVSQGVAQLDFERTGEIFFRHDLFHSQSSTPRIAEVTFVTFNYQAIRPAMFGFRKDLSMICLISQPVPAFPLQHSGHPQASPPPRRSPSGPSPPWIDSLDPATHARIVRALDLLAETGPGLGRPLVDTINGSTIANLKELRPGTVRILFALDPWRASGTPKPTRWPNNATKRT